MVVVQSVPMTTKVVSLITVHGEVYSIQYYVKKIVSDLLQVCGFLFPVYSTYKTDCHDITEILLKVMLNTITQPAPLSKIFQLYYGKNMIFLMR
jgi:hypothetical protein